MRWAPGTREVIRAAARQAAPREACGALLGHEGTVEDVLVMTNTAGDDETYSIDSAELLALLTREDAGEVHIVGWWHTHPNTDSAPSEVDRALALPGYAYVIHGTDGFTEWSLQH